MTHPKKSLVPSLASTLLLLALSACNSGGGGGASAPALTPASVAGTWSGAGAEGQRSSLTSCSGDLTSLDGADWSPALGVLDGCTVTPLPVTQSGDTFTIAAARYHCGSIGINGTLSGRGTVSGTSVQGEIDDVAEGFSDRLARRFTGVVVGNQLQLTETRLEVRDPGDGPVTGACELAPPLTSAAALAPAGQPATSVCGGSVTSEPVVCQLRIVNSAGSPEDPPVLVPDEISALRFGLADAEGDVTEICRWAELLDDAGNVVAASAPVCAALARRPGLVNEFAADEVQVPSDAPSGNLRFMLTVGDAAGNKSEPAAALFSVITF